MGSCVQHSKSPRQMEELAIDHSRVGNDENISKIQLFWCHAGECCSSSLPRSEGVCAPSLYTEKIACEGVICSQSWIFIWLLFECCLRFLLNMMSLRLFIHYFLYTLCFFNTIPKGVIKHLQCVCSSFWISNLMAFTVPATAVFHFFTWFSSLGLCDMVLLKSPFLIILWHQDIFSGALSIKFFQKKVVLCLQEPVWLSLLLHVRFLFPFLKIFSPLND